MTASVFGLYNVFFARKLERKGVNDVCVLCSAGEVVQGEFITLYWFQ